MHPITEASPFYNFKEADFKNAKGEILVYVKAFDDMFSNTVVSRTSYTMDELIIGAIFNPVYHKTEDNSKTILHINELNSFHRVPLDI